MRLDGGGEGTASAGEGVVGPGVQPLDAMTKVIAHGHTSGAPGKSWNYEEVFAMDLKSTLDDADKLPAAARMLAVSSYGRFCDEYPLLREVSPDHWDFVLTIAGIFVAVSKLSHDDTPETVKDTILTTVTNAALEVYPDCLEASENCADFVDRTYDGLSESQEYLERPEFLFSDSLGAWMVWNLVGHSPLCANNGETKFELS
jgi:hypothetical protein